MLCCLLVFPFILVVRKRHSSISLSLFLFSLVLMTCSSYGFRSFFLNMLMLFSKLNCCILMVLNQIDLTLNFSISPEMQK